MGRAQCGVPKNVNYIRALRASWGLVKESITWLTGSASNAAIPGLGNYGAMCGACHGIIGSLVMKRAPVRINAVACGLTRTEAWGKLGMPAEAQNEMYENFARFLPTQSVALPEAIAESMFFAATNRYATGTVTDTSGGMVRGRFNQNTDQPS